MKIYLFSVIFSLLVISTFSRYIHHNLNASQYQNYTFPSTELVSLYDLYVSTHGDYWLWKPNITRYGIPWNFSTLNPNPCNDNWQGIWCDVDESSQTSHTYAIYFFGFNMTGKLPDSISNLTELSILSLPENQLTGSLTSSICSLSQLQFIGLDFNNLTGTLPSNIGNLTALNRFMIAGNFLTGSFPDSFQQLPHLTQFDISFNFLEGSIPLWFGNLTSLKVLRLAWNLFTGPIPNELTNLIHIKQMYVSINYLTGTIPSFFEACPNMTTLYVSENLLTGTLPSTHFNQNPDMFNFEFMINSLTGTLPPEYAYFPSLHYLVGATNLLTGTLPSEYSQLTNLTTLAMLSNLLSGEIPTSYDKLHKIDYFEIGLNYFKGTIPSTLLNLPLLTYLELQDNYFTGIFPFTTKNHSLLVDVNISSNLFTGSLPQYPLLSSKIKNFDISLNYFTGPIETIFAQLTELEILFLHNNQFIGSLSGFVNSTIQPNLTHIDVSANSFSGSLPVKELSLSKIQTFAAIQNCFSGTLSDLLCQISTLNSLVLDGLHASPTCIHNFFPHFINTYPLGHYFHGTIPQCLYFLLNLDTLHLSGNGFTGTLPENLPIGSSLKDLSISHNQIGGTFPKNFQIKPWTDLDLSFNRLSGYLNHNISTSFANIIDTTSNQTAYLYLQVNRFSGTIPKTLKYTSEINILRGGLYECNYNKDELPINDPYHSRFKCGSNEINLFFASYGGLIGFILTFIFIWLIKQSFFHSNAKSAQARRQWMREYFTRCYHKMYIEENSWWKISSDQHQVYPNIYQFMLLNRQFRSLSLFITLFALIILMPINAILTVFYGTYKTQDIWEISSIFLSGSTPAIVLFLVLFFFLLSIHLLVTNCLQSFRFYLNESSRTIKVCIEDTTIDTNADSSTINNIQINYPLDSNNKATETTQSNNNNSSQSTTTAWTNKLYTFLTSETCLFYSFACILLIVNAFIVLTINMLYVYCNSINIHSGLLVFITILISGFKIVWNNIMVLNIFFRYLIDPSALFYVRTTDFIKPTKAISPYYYTGLLLLFVLTIFNSIGAPLISDMAMSSRCFYYLLVPPPVVESSYSFLTCSNYAFFARKYFCLDYAPTYHTISYSPPFTYAYQCSFALINNFTMVFLIRYILSGVLLPFLNIIIKFFQEKRQGKTRYFWESSLYHILPPMMRILSSKIDRIDPNSQNKEVKIDTENPLQSESSDPEINISQEASKTQISSDKTNYYIEKYTNIFDIESYLLILLSDIAVLLTFGIFFPPLSIIILISIWVQTIMNQLLIGRIMRMAQHHPLILNQCIQQIEQKCSLKHLLNLIDNSIKWILLFTMIFWSFCLFDILGDAVGWLNSLWLVILTLCIPLIIWLLKPFINYCKIFLDSINHLSWYNTSSLSQKKESTDRINMTNRLKSTEVELQNVS